MIYTTETNGYSETVDVLATDTKPEKTERIYPGDVEEGNQLARLLKVHQGLSSFSQKYSFEMEEFQLRLTQIRKNLQHEQPFRVAVMATTGTGKSTLLNALLARSLVLVKGSGGAATGCALHVLQDVASDQTEYAMVKYRDEEDIRDLIKQNFTKPYDLEFDLLDGKIDEGLAAALKRLEAPDTLLEEERSEFRDLRDALVNLVKQAARNSACLGTEIKFSFDRKDHEVNLLELIDENSDKNQSSERQVGLIKAVHYHIHSSKTQELKLPPNVCLIDLPGLDGSHLHNIVIREGIKDADAILFVLPHQRFKTLSNKDLLRRALYAVGIGDDPKAAERIFFIINAKDQLNDQPHQAIATIHQEIPQFVEEILPGSSRYCHPYIISALAALQAQQVLRGEGLSNFNKYESIKVSLGVRDGSDRDVLLASDVPLLAQKLGHFLTGCRERQMREASQGLSQLIGQVVERYTSERQALEANWSDPRQRLNQLLEERLEDLKRVVKQVRKTQIEHLPEHQRRLQDLAAILCNEIDRQLQAEMPNYWKKNFIEAEVEPHAVSFARVMKEGFLGQIEVSLWEQASLKMKRLAEEVVDIYQNHLEISDIPMRIAEKGLGQIHAETIQAKLQEGVTNMRATLESAMKPLILAQIVDPGKSFSPYSEDSAEHNRFLLQLKALPLDPELRPAAFDELMQSIRQHYQQSIYGECILGLINLYRYEMLRLERLLIQDLRSSFGKMRQTVSPEVLLQVASTSSNSDVEQLTLLDEKLTTLRSLHDILKLRGGDLVEA